MLAWLRLLRLQRLVVAVVVGAFVSVASATVACQVDCAFQAKVSEGHHGNGHLTAPDVGTSEAGHHDVPTQHFSDHLRHAGPCHLAAIPLLTAPARDSAMHTMSRQWTSASASAYTSFVGPPPKHRPRA